LKKAGALLDIEVFDHVIIGEAGSFVSMRESGLMPRD
jgi:DNA repair protein RadC